MSLQVGTALTFKDVQVRLWYFVSKDSSHQVPFPMYMTVRARYCTVLHASMSRSVGHVTSLMASRGSAGHFQAGCTLA
jgi:hypothetical protein